MGLSQHVIRNHLGQKERAFQVNVHNIVVFFFGDFQNIHPDPGGYSGIIHQDFYTAKMIQKLFDHALAIRFNSDISLTVKQINAVIIFKRSKSDTSEAVRIPFTASE